ncbi:hypothetical protein V7166_17190 [Bacillus thuringiensis]|uniref:hypothetical protein n=1 Tax=Bacillus wiedmannii TaxID=1890302 RepID=UPI0021D3015D|nr:hypothetical protein [Bacillus wiedmannii]MCU5575861.1 hypothetical protein [Bacillus wiedmannii]
MGKKYIEFILENQEHMQKIQELEIISREYMDYLLGKLQIDSKGVSISCSKIHTKENIENEFQQLIEDNYFLDADCDFFGLIEYGYNQALHELSPQELIAAIKCEQKRRHTRKRHPKKSWEKLKSFGLE